MKIYATNVMIFRLKKNSVMHLKVKFFECSVEDSRHNYETFYCH